jgi:hypothetical protein
MQGHPEAPQLLEKHADTILRSICLTPTTHEPCLYSGFVQGHHILPPQQVDNFAVAAINKMIAGHVFDLNDDNLTIPLKSLGLITLFNGLGITQTKHYIKISCTSYISWILEKYLDDWMGKHHMLAKPTPLPPLDSFQKSFLSAKGDPSPAIQEKLSKNMGLQYRNALGELIYALVTCQPEILYAVMK